MIANYATPNPRLTFAINCESAQDLFTKLARVDELFGEKECGLCHSPAIIFAVRETQSGKWFEMRCTACRAKLDFGTSRDGTKFWCKRWDKEAKKPLQNGGWHIYDPNAPRANGVPGDADESNPPNQPRVAAGNGAGDQNDFIPF